MQWNDSCILLSASKYGERAGVIGLFSRAHGIHRSISKNAYTSKQRGLYQPGNIAEVEWKARLAEHMGSITADLQRPIAPLLLDDPLALDALGSICSLLQRFIHEREPHPALYDRTEALLTHMAAGHVWQPYYVKWELALLAELGYGLDLSECAATGQTHELVYVSPKSGRAVCREAGAPYAEKMLALPAFLISDAAAEEVDEACLYHGLTLTGYFLQQWVATPHHMQLPDARYRLAERLEKRQEKQSA